MDEIWSSLRLLLLLGLANTTPLVAKRWFGPHWRAPLDDGLMFFHGRPLLGSSKARSVAWSLPSSPPRSERCSWACRQR